MSRCIQYIDKMIDIEMSQQIISLVYNTMRLPKHLCKVMGTITCNNNILKNSPEIFHSSSIVIFVQIKFKNIFYKTPTTYLSIPKLISSGILNGVKTQSQYLID